MKGEIKMKKYKFNKKKFTRFIITTIIAIAAIITYIDFVRFPECYITTWKHQLKLDIERGDEKMIEYYETNYVANGRELFE